MQPIPETPRDPKPNLAASHTREALDESKPPNPQAAELRSRLLGAPDDLWDHIQGAYPWPDSKGIDPAAIAALEDYQSWQDLAKALGHISLEDVSWQLGVDSRRKKRISGEFVSRLVRALGHDATYDQIRELADTLRICCNRVEGVPDKVAGYTKVLDLACQLQRDRSSL